MRGDKMRKLFTLFGIAALLCLAIVPVFAQEVKLLDAARNTDELSTFMSAVETAGIVLPAGRSFTIFAPSNEAWEQLSDRLGMTVDELMADRDLLEQILNYHIVGNQYRIEDLSTQLDEENHLFLRTLEGSQILVTGTSAGLTLNENLLSQDIGSQIVMSDIFGANGVIHVIDSVLLPPTDVLDTAKVRIANFVDDVPRVDVFINGVLSGIEPIAFDAASGWVEVPSGRYEIAFVPAGGTLDQALGSPFTVVLAPDAWVTVAATGSAVAQTVQTQLVTEDFDTILEQGTGRLTVFFDLEENQTLNVLANESIIAADFQVNAEDGGSFTVDLPNGVYDLQFVSAVESQELVLSTTVGVEAQTTNLVTVTGTREAPEIFVEVMQIEEVNEIINVSQPATGQ
jgi:uncharacterized surface protein with fasciclin (FAS1) repeats